MNKEVKIYWCQEDEIATTAVDSTILCKRCNEKMLEIGWIEIHD